jgi:hypothetical protein
MSGENLDAKPFVPWRRIFVPDAGNKHLFDFIWFLAFVPLFPLFTPFRGKNFFREKGASHG